MIHFLGPNANSVTCGCTITGGTAGAGGGAGGTGPGGGASGGNGGAGGISGTGGSVAGSSGVVIRTQVTDPATLIH